MEEKCTPCDGEGYVVLMDHDRRCDGSCKAHCPIQRQELCKFCEGTGIKQ